LISYFLWKESGAVYPGKNHFLESEGGVIRLVQVGLGPMGQRIAKAAVERGHKFVAAVDPAPDKAGRDLGTLCGLPRLGVKVSPDLRSARGAGRAEAALLTTVSSLKAVESQVAELARAGLDIVSTCEEMVYPWKTAPALAKRIDRLCRRHGVTCLSTGVNPGFLMDFLPVVLTSVCAKVERIVVRRIQDASPRRAPFQRKIGAGLTRRQFAAKKATGTLRHVGLTESMHLIAAGVGWNVDRTSETLRPIIADRRITSGYMPIEPGMACGVEQIGRAWAGKRLVIRLEFRAAVGEPGPRDEVEISGIPDLHSVIPGGVNGDIATTAMVLNTLPRVLGAAPGLKTMLDVPAGM
jgi:4-hydroxy-tetrahydrodipicolinate reductase